MAARRGLGIVTLALTVLSAAPAAAAETVVHMTGNRYAPASVTIAPGDTVRWVNDDQVTHTVTADDGSFDAAVQPGGFFTRSFPHPVDVTYFCTIHGSDAMSGRVLVVAPRSATTTTTSSSTTTTTAPTTTTTTTAPTTTTSTTTTTTTAPPTTTTATTTADDEVAAPTGTTTTTIDADQIAAREFPDGDGTPVAPLLVFGGLYATALGWALVAGGRPRRVR